MKIGSILLGNRRNVTPIFVGSYGNHLTRGIYAFQVDVDTGEFIKKAFFKSENNPIQMFRRERFVYVCYNNNSGRITEGGISQYAAMVLQFGLAAKVAYQGKTYVDVFVNEDRTYGYAVDYYNGEVVVIPILNQKIVKMTQVIKHVGSGSVPKRQEQAHPCFIHDTPDHKRMIVCDLGTDEVVLYKIVEKGQLERDEDNSFKLKPGSGPKKVVFSKDGQFAYVLNELSNTIAVYRYDDCHFTFVQEVDTFPKEDYVGVSYAGDMIISDQGDILFVSNKGHDSVSCYYIDQESGKLDFIEFVDTDENPRSLMLINDRWLIVAAQKGGTLESFELKRNESKGVLFETHFNYMIGEPVCMVHGREI